MPAIHIEKLDSLEAGSFVNATRGVPEKIRSGNGTNFVAGERELREAMQSWKDDSKVKAYLLQKEIKWEFNPPAASHMGGIWKRRMRTVRKVLNVILRKQTLDDERLSTLFCEVESIVNERPLTVLSDDQSDESPLTQNHLLLLRGGPKLPPVSLIRVIFTEGVGDMSSFSLISFGNAGYANTCPFCSCEESGYSQRGICRMEMWSLSWERTLPGRTGLWGE